MRSFALAALAACVVSAAPQEEKVEGMPDSMPFDTDSYSGFLDVTETKKLHYMFVESQSNPSEDPVLIWFNGGPGCSSMLGFINEHGPRVIDDGEQYVKNNPFPWNTRQNVLYLESPAGVGWSIAGDEKDWHTDDMQQSEDAIIALKSWYEKFPEFKQNELFVSGESYGGIYVPYLSW
mmetsp:Transcript_97755/g.134478  ORF Transcript_97755/g.134478 Transcript_97755/m.134478 type:complete len:178 (+) Transcript_97755:23-556(+)|eukprot:CAMPEP_0176366066 /NCGR_PEP_ID=MMETSP0126-20121128/20919_1 /TAXON_ID=141414 ORGANISM="Strombidinopsis acuminatum, Strain SPMC142" /NCGR_SAMPLE_ID=MMETSP0126 /ASSEMBLY_ACC=CAM_ASM_000229 /LENGTH=177 /DNA_ID=CAMNT_0017723337 /DNA_START=21 /DNA_END=554 /DNA_ORIENTATION=+